MRELLTFLLLFMASVTLSNAAEKVDVKEFATKLEQPDVLLLDVRTPEEIAAGKIEGAIELDFQSPDFSEKLDQLPRDKTVLLYCRSDNRSGRAAALLEQKGFRQVVDLQGGILAWKSANMPLVSEDK